MTLILPAAGPGARLFDVVPQMFDALDGRPGALGLNPAESAIVLVLDGLGARNLQAHSGHARFLSSHMGKRDVGQTVFPSTTAAALTSLLTGRAPGEHGIVGYRALVPERNLVSNQLTGWEDDGLDPLTWQRSTPLLEAEAARRTFVVSNAKYARSGFTAATMRGAEFHAADALEARLALATALASKHPGSLSYVYAADLDAVGHKLGVASSRWIETLENVDAAVARFAAALPARIGVIVTADHGMVDVPAHKHVLLRAGDERTVGVRHIGGEPRMLHLYAEPGAESAMLEVWRAREAQRAWVLSRDEAIEAGLFGEVAAEVVPRIGDVLVAARGRVAYYDDRLSDKRAQSMVGQHGSLTDEECTVPMVRLGAFAR